MVQRRLYLYLLGVFLFFHVSLSAAQAPATSSDLLSIEASSEMGDNLAKCAFDDNLDTRWESQHGVDSVWLKFELKKEQTVSAMEVDWETASAKKYEVQFSQNGTDWKTIVTVADGASGDQRLMKFTPAKARYVRINCTERTTQWGYSIWEIILNPEIELEQKLSDQDVSKLPYMNPNLPISNRVENLLSTMSLKEKIEQITGKDPMDGRVNERLKIPALLVSDGPHGIRGFGEATCYPTLIAAATWDLQLMNRIGMAIGEEALFKGRNVVLGPCINIHRTPLGGRNFESMSEDPFLVSKMAVAYITGVQSQKVGTSVKHFACNNQEWERGSISVEIGERALREIYLPGFQAAICDAKATTIMGAYNRINGDYCCQNQKLLTDILKKEWEFKGLVVSDWGAVHDTLKAALAGCDLEMPGPGQYFATSRIMSEIRKGTISKTIIDDKVRRILYVKFYLGLFDSPGKRGPGEANTKKHQDLCREVAENGMVLLKNSGNILPLNINTVKSIAVIGPNAKNLPLDGGGSSEVLAPYLVSPEMGLRDKCGEKVVVKYATGCTLPYDWKEVSVKGNAPNKTAKIRIRCMSSGMATGNGNSYIWFDNGSLSSPQGSIEIKNNSFEKWTEDWVKTGNVKDNGVFDWHKIDKARSYGMGNDQGPANASGEISQVIDVNGKVKRGDLCTFKMWAKPEKLYTGKANLQIEFLSAGGTVLGSSTSGEIKINEGYDDESIAEAVETAKKCDYAVVFIGLNGNQEGEGKDKENMLLPPGQDILVDAIYRANKKTIIVLMSGTPVDMQKWVDQVPGIVYAFYTGQEGGNAIANLLFGDVNPSGKLPFTMPKKLEDNPSYGNYPGSGGKVEYAEGIFVGYRFYDTKKVDPLFPFGYGLSYTSFKYANLQVTPEKMDSAGTITVSLDLENSGSVEGKEVVQLYIRDLESSLERPLRELKEFQKINLKPGEKKKIIFKLKKDALSFYDSAKKSWVAEPGLFEVQIGSSSRDIRLTKTFELLK